MWVPISYLGFCALGALTNPRLMSRAVYVGKYYHHTEYWFNKI